MLDQTLKLDKLRFDGKLNTPNNSALLLEASKHSENGWKSSSGQDQTLGEVAR
jgi:hypothetical protein